ncbi:MAG: hypothetical protein GYA45_11585 [Pelolinea sp.]|nr:hypothetical protein [Pelolinea sp.]
MNRQIFCTVNQLIDDLDLRGFSEANLLDRIKEASDLIQRHPRGGDFIPVTATKYFGAPVDLTSKCLSVPPLLAVTSITNDGEAVTDYHLKPFNGLWEDGPYIEIEMDEGGGFWADEDDVVISGWWGKYEKTADLGITGSQATTSETTLEIDNGSLLCPGMVIKIEDEQEYVTAGNGSPGGAAATAATSKVNGAIDELDTSITVDNGAEFYAGEVLQIGVEDLKIIKKNTHVLFVERGWNGTVPADHADDSAIGVYRTFTVERGVNGTTAAAHSSKAIYQMVVPATVNYLCQKLAGLLRAKVLTSFTGVSGNNEAGQSRYGYEFDQRSIDDVLRPFTIWSD